MSMVRKITKCALLIVLGSVTLSLSTCILLEPSPPLQEEASPSWSPDGKHIAYECYLEGPIQEIAESNQTHFTEEAADICIIEVDGGDPIRLTNNIGADRYPVWAPSGSQIAYTRSDGIYVANADGSNQRRLVPLSHGRFPSEIGKVAWSPDGNRLLFSACLKSSDHRDVYLVDVYTADLTNLTPDDRQDLNPMWTLDGTKIVFWSAGSFDRMPGVCFPSENANFRLKVINADGTGEEVVYDKEIFSPFASVSNTGQIAFISDLASKTAQGYLRSERTYLYTIDLDQKEPVLRSTASRLVSWSPNDKYLVYEDRGVLIWEVETGAIHKLPSIQPERIGPHVYHYLIDDISGWSPDSLQIAVTTSADPTGFYSEKHILIFNLQSNTFRPLINN